MARRGRRAEARHRYNIVFGTILIVFVVAVVLATWYFFATKSKGVNPETMCPLDGPLGHYVLLVDKTDPLTFTQNQAFSVVLRELIEKRIPEGYLLSVFVLGEDFKSSAAPIVELCNPGSGVGRSDWTDNLKRLRRKYEERFVEPLLKQSASLLATESAKVSPVFEMMQLVGVNGFRKHSVKGERRLIVVSDMLHNTPQLSMYKAPVDYKSFSETSYGMRMQLELRDVEVELHYLMNSPQLQTKRNLKFWEDYFERAGARIVEVRPLEG